MGASACSRFIKALWRALQRLYQRLALHFVGGKHKSAHGNKRIWDWLNSKLHENFWKDLFLVGLVVLVVCPVVSVVLRFWHGISHGTMWPRVYREVVRRQLLAARVQKHQQQQQ